MIDHKYMCFFDDDTGFMITTDKNHYHLYDKIIPSSSYPLKRNILLAAVAILKRRREKK